MELGVQTKSGSGSDHFRKTGSRSKLDKIPDPIKTQPRTKALEDRLPGLVVADSLDVKLKGLEAKIPTLAESTDLQQRVKQLESGGADSKDMKEKVN